MSVVKGSAMRFSLTIISISVSIAILGIVAYVILLTVQEKQVDWTGLGLFVGGLAALLTGSGWNKTKQNRSITISLT